DHIQISPAVGDHHPVAQVAGDHVAGPQGGGRDAADDVPVGRLEQIDAVAPVGQGPGPGALRADAVPRDHVLEGAAGELDAVVQVAGNQVAGPVPSSTDR